MAELEQAKSQIIANASEITQVCLHRAATLSHYSNLSRALPPRQKKRLRDMPK